MKTIDTDNLGAWAAALDGLGWRVVAPLREGGRTRLDLWRAGAVIDLDAHPVNAAKDAVMPPSEVVGSYRLAGDAFTPEPLTPDATPTVLLGARPCDLAALAVLDAVLGGEGGDPFYTARRRHLAVAVAPCTRADAACFCTSVGGAPDATGGADLALRRADAGRRLILEPLTDRGVALAAAAEPWSAEVDAQPDPPPSPAVAFDASAVTDWCVDHFDAGQWEAWSLACLGCGACTQACGACHCFDIHDEAGPARAIRYRTWDTCALGAFTRHAGGHNPRPLQAQRIRQRVLHKFLYLPERVGLLGCTGCGRCERLCQVGLGMSQIGRAVTALAGQGDTP